MIAGSQIATRATVEPATMRKKAGSDIGLLLGDNVIMIDIAEGCIAAFVRLDEADQHAAAFADGEAAFDQGGGSRPRPWAFFWNVHAWTASISDRSGLDI